VSRLNRFLNLWRQREIDREIDDELAFHLEMRAEKNLRGGMGRAEAQAEARRHLGGALRAKEAMREARMMVWLEAVAADVRHGGRVLRRRAGLATLAIVTMSLGIGANAAIFTLLNAILLRPLPFADPDRLVAIVDRFSRLGETHSPTIPEILDMREQQRVFSNVGFFDTRDFQMTGGDEPTRVFTARVSASLFPTLGVQPALGRLFTDTDNLAGHWDVALLSDGLWRRNFGADPTVLGRTLMVNGKLHTVIGVLPRAFTVEYPGLAVSEPIEMYVPFQMYEAYMSRKDPFVNVRRVTTIGRLQAGIGREQASADLLGISQGIASAHRDLYWRVGESLGFSLDVEPLHEVVAKSSRPTLLLLFGAVALVLLIACVNTGQFLLAQSLDREQEVAVRASLGAGRARLFGQFLAECSVLAFAGGALGLLQALWLVPALIALLPGHSPQLAAASVDRTVLGFTAAISMLSALAVGVLPATYFSRANPGARLGVRGRTSVGNRSRHLLVAVEVALAIVLLAAAGLLIQGLRHLQEFDRGLSAENVTVMQVRMPVSAQSVKPIGSAIFQHYVDHISAMAGVEAAAAATPLPLRNPPQANFAIEGRPNALPDLERQSTSFQIVSPDYFKVFRIPLLEGRGIAIDDIVGRPRVAVINQTMARRYWPGESPIGRQIRVGNVLTIVGVVGDVQTMVFDTQKVPQIYVSNLQQSEPNMNIVVRASSGSAITSEALKKAIWSVAPDQPVFNMQPMSQLISRSFSESRYLALLLGVFAALALLMSATGVYTAVSYLVSRRTREIAVRLAVGARARDIVRLVSGQTLGWTVVGLAVGMAIAVASNGVTRAALRGVGNLDLPTMAALSAFYLAVAIGAMCVPVARALKFLDPAAALRTE